MSQQPPDEEFERRLRDVFHPRGLGVPVPPGALDRIHAGARRRQQRRSAGAVLSAVAVIGVVATSIALRPESHGATVTAGQHTSTPSPPVAQSSSLSPSPSRRPSASASAPPVVVPTPVVSPPTVGAPASFQPLSVSAIGPNVYWVLGSTPCATGRCAAIEHTSDAGVTFTRVGRTSSGGDMPRVPTAAENGTTVRDVRFGDAQNGWLYGGALYATHDGGSTWTVDSSLPNDVLDVAAESGNVWAVALRADSSGELYGLYHATYGSGGTSGWSQVQLGTTLVGQPSLAVIKKTAYLVEGAGAQQITYVITNGGASTAVQPGPCSATPTLGSGQLSVAGDGSLWAWCTAGRDNGVDLSSAGPVHDSGVYVSTDGAAHWHGVIRPTTTSVGGIDSSRAIVSDGAGLTMVPLGQPETTPTVPDSGAQTNARFIGFTTTKIGFLIDDPVAASAELWRTTDGGQTWAVVTL